MQDKEFNVELLKKYVLEKKTDTEIAELMGVSKGTVMNRVIRNGLSGIRAEKIKIKRGAGDNADRHLCVDCKYRCKNGRGCDYIIRTGKERGCDAAECDRYEKEQNNQANQASKHKCKDVANEATKHEYREARCRRVTYYLRGV